MTLTNLLAFGVAAAATTTTTIVTRRCGPLPCWFNSEAADLTNTTATRGHTHLPPLDRSRGYACATTPNANAVLPQTAEGTP